MLNNFYNYPWRFKEGEFYFIQIIRRAKDQSVITAQKWDNNQRLINSYYIYTQEQLDLRMDEMIAIADATVSRVMVHPARRNKMEIAKLTQYLLAQNMYSNTIDGISRIYNTACWTSRGVERLRLIDVDGENAFDLAKDIIFDITTTGLYWVQERENYILPTKNWCHIICKPFNSKVFSERFPWVDIHKNNPTVLYIPDTPWK